MCNDIDTVTVIDLDPAWSLAELLPALELYDADIKLDERVEDDVALNAFVLIIPGAVSPSEVLTTIAENVNDDGATYG